MRAPNILLFILIGCALCSCKKEDESKPNIVITAPIGYPSYNFNDVVVVKAEITDDENIEWVKYDIIDQSNRNVVAEKNINLENTTSYTLENTLTIDNIYTSTGTHYIRVRAFDGINTSVEFKEIQIYGVPLKTEGVVLTEHLGSYSKTYYLNADLEIQSWLTTSSPIWISEIDQFKQRLAYGSESGFTLHGLGLAGSGENTNVFLGSTSATPSFTCSTFLKSTQRIMVGYSNGKVFHAPSDASSIGVLGSFELLNGFISNSFLETTFGLFIGQKSNLDVNKISVHNPGVYNEFQSITVEFDILSIHEVNDRVIVIGNDTEGGVVAEYFPGPNGISVLSEFNNFDPIICAEVFGDGPRVMISTAIETLELNLNNSNLASGYSWNISARQMEFNRASQEMYGLSDDRLFSFTTGSSTIETIEYLDDFVLFNIRYNKDPDY